MELKKEYSSEELIEIAIKRIKIKRSLYSHIASYLFVNAFLVFLYYMSKDFQGDYGDMPWYLMSIAGWGLGLLFHIFNTVQDLKYKFNTNVLERELKHVNANTNNREGL